MEEYNIENWKDTNQTNLSLTTDLVKIRKSREEGESDLVNLARTADLEASWMYSPSNSTWYNTGIEHQTDPSQANRPLVVSVSPGKLKTIGNTFDFYHTHPKRFIDEDITRQQTGYTIEHYAGTDDPALRVRFAKALVAREIYVAAATASFDDISGIMGAQAMNSDLKLTEKIVGDYGVFTIQLRTLCPELLQGVIFDAYEDFSMNHFQKLAIASTLRSDKKMLSREGIHSGISDITSHLNRAIPQIIFSFNPIK